MPERGSRRHTPICGFSQGRLDATRGNWLGLPVQRGNHCDYFSGVAVQQESAGISIAGPRSWPAVRSRKSIRYAPIASRSASARVSVQRVTSSCRSASTITRASGSVPE